MQKELVDWVELLIVKVEVWGRIRQQEEAEAEHLAAVNQEEVAHLVVAGELQEEDKLVVGLEVHHQEEDVF